MGAESEVANGETAYARAGRGGRSAAAVAEVWLRGNLRPVLGVGLLVGGGLALALAATVQAGASPAVTRSVADALAGVVACGIALACVAVGPRLGRRGDALLVRLSPWRTEEVPLALVECVFPGSQPLTGPVLEQGHVDAADGPASTRRVGTLVIRFAERAREWHDRPTFAAWGTWHDGHAIIDGRWCEPLSAAVAQRIGQRLLEAKREAAEVSR